MLTNNKRMEHDFLGEKEIPADVYYGIQTLRAVENFPITGYRIHEELIKALAMVKKAAAIANMKTTRLYSGLGSVMCQAADEIIEGKWNDQFIVDPIQGGAGTSMNMNVNEVIANRALELLGHEKGAYNHLSPNSHVNMSQSTNDAFPTAMHISAYTKIVGSTLPVIEKLIDSLINKSLAMGGIIKTGRTHLMDATPISLGQEFSGYVSQLKHGVTALKNTLPHLSELALGGTAVGTGLNTPEGYDLEVAATITRLTNLPFITAENKFEALAANDAIVEVHGAIKQLAVSLMKIA
ncbi:MAG: lyase family protein, partial [Neobacillus sp.]